MNIIPLKSVGPFSFEDSIDVVLNKGVLLDFQKTKKTVIDDVYPVLYSLRLNLNIVFNVNGDKIRYFEVFKKGLIFEKNDFFVLGFSESFKLCQRFDSKILKDDDGFVSRKLGIVVGRKLVNGKYGNMIESILLASDGYFSDPKISPDDFLKILEE